MQNLPPPDLLDETFLIQAYGKGEQIGIHPPSINANTLSQMITGPGRMKAKNCGKQSLLALSGRNSTSTAARTQPAPIPSKNPVMF